MGRTHRYFGTDGVRGVYGTDLTDELVTRLGRAFATWRGGGAVLVGRDTRASGVPLEQALAAGLAACGSDVTLGSVLPTPAVALLAPEAGAVVSASHNPAEYNGVKFFVDGWKLSDEDEGAIEALLAVGCEAQPGVIAEGSSLADAYVDRVVTRFGAPLGGLRVGVDCANGAMSRIAPAAFERIGATVVAVANDPDGTNINRGCGATDLSLLSEVAREQRLELGVAFDGDGDRMLAVDSDGNEVDGDEIVAILALHLGVDLVAVTAMSNLGLHRLMAERGIRVVTTDVGDRYVLEALRREGGVLGGEQSGHLIYLNGHTSGDGLVAAILLCRAVVESGRTLAELAAQMPRLPQARSSVPVRTQTFSPTLQAEFDRIARELGDRGRILVRPSGTEPVVRVLVEAENEEDASVLCATIGHLVQQELGW
jgi:phosphoglucosamine mutase